MTTLGEQSTSSTSTSASPMPNLNACYDPDIDSFINLDQLTYTSAESARPKPALISQPSVARSDSSASDIGSGTLASSQPQIPFPGPSHQYDDHKQQTGLPPGAVAHAMAINGNAMGFNMGGQGFAMNGGMFGGMNVKHEEAPIDFGSVPARNPSEMDLESDKVGSLPAYYFPSNQTNKNQFIDPNALGGHELSPIGPPAQVGRMYPGMHQQQAAMAKAAQQQKQHEIIRQQQLQQRRIEEHARQTGRQSRPNRHPDPVVEERISRLLQQMRQSSVGSQEDSSTPANMLPHMAKAKKDEEEMDEDERLLASEEGKKLSSKERRQLRNKVSARAFRSRRKEYIGQLEGEVAAKTNEANDLRIQNRTLFEENARLTDLTRMLLSSPHFASFLNDLSVNGMSGQPQQPQQPQVQHQQVVSQPSMQPNTHKDVNPSRVAQEFHMQQNAQVGMVMVQDHGVDVSSMDMNSGCWNSGIDMNFTNAPVFAVLEVPEPAIDSGLLSGKTSNFVGSAESTKDEVPCIERPPMVDTPKEESTAGIPDPDVEIDESDPAFALFLDSPPAPKPSCDQFEDLFGGIEPEKAFATFELVVEDESNEISAAAMDRFARLCHNMEAAFQRVSMVTSHLL